MYLTQRYYYTYIDASFVIDYIHYKLSYSVNNVQLKIDKNVLRVKNVCVVPIFRMCESSL